MIRDLGLDALKGVLIIYIVAAHNNAFPEGVLRFTHPAIIGAFILTSGFLTKDHFNLRRRLKSLIYPFMLFFIIGVVWQLGYGYLIHEHIDVKDYLLDLVIGRDLRFNIPLWFLISLAEIYVIKKGMDLLPVSQFANGCIAAASFVCGISLLSHGVNYFYISQALVYLPFFCAGRWLRRHRYVLNRESSQWLSLSLITYFLIVRVIFLEDTIREGDVWVCYLVDSLIGCILAYWIYSFFSTVKCKHPFFFFGRHSLVVMSLHIILLDFVWRIWWSLFGAPAVVGGIIQTVVIVLLLVPCCIGYEQFVSPYMVAKKKS